MRLRLIAVGSRMPKWVEEGWHEYAKRLPSELALELVEIPLNTRGKNADVARLIRQDKGTGKQADAPGYWGGLSRYFGVSSVPIMSSLITPSTSSMRRTSSSTAAA